MNDQDGMNTKAGPNGTSKPKPVTSVVEAMEACEKNSSPKGDSSHDMRLLPDGFQPSEHDVICGRGRKTFNHPGNEKFRAIVKSFLPQYSRALAKLEKSYILSDVVEQVRKNCSAHNGGSGGGFVKKDPDTGKWYEVGDFLAREKTSQAFRDILFDKYKSSNTAKKKRRQEEQAGKLFRSNSNRSLGDTSVSTVGSVSVHGGEDNMKFMRVERNDQFMMGSGGSSRSLMGSMNNGGSSRDLIGNIVGGSGRSLLGPGSSMGTSFNNNGSQTGGFLNASGSGPSMISFGGSARNLMGAQGSSSRSLLSATGDSSRSLMGSNSQHSHATGVVSHSTHNGGMQGGTDQLLGQLDHDLVSSFGQCMNLQAGQQRTASARSVLMEFENSRRNLLQATERMGMNPNDLMMNNNNMNSSSPQFNFDLTGQAQQQQQHRPTTMRRLSMTNDVERFVGRGNNNGNNMDSDLEVIGGHVPGSSTGYPGRRRGSNNGADWMHHSQPNMNFDFNPAAAAAMPPRSSPPPSGGGRGQPERVQQLPPAYGGRSTMMQQQGMPQSSCTGGSSRAPVERMQPMPPQRMQQQAMAPTGGTFKRSPTESEQPLPATTHSATSTSTTDSSSLTSPIPLKTSIGQHGGAAGDGGAPGGINMVDLILSPIPDEGERNLLDDVTGLQNSFAGGEDDPFEPDPLPEAQQAYANMNNNNNSNGSGERRF